MDSVLVRLSEKEGWLLEAVFKGRGLWQTPLFCVIKIYTEAIVKGEAIGQVDEPSLWFTIDLLPAGFMVGDTRGAELLKKLYKLALSFYESQDIPMIFKESFKEGESDDKDRAESPARDFTQD